MESDLADSLYADTQGCLIALLNASPLCVCLGLHPVPYLCERYSHYKADA